MKSAKVLKAVAVSTLLVAGTAGNTAAEDRLVSGEPYPDFFASKGVKIEAYGPRVRDVVVLEAPSRRVIVERFAIPQVDRTEGELVALYPEAFIGRSKEARELPSAFAMTLEEAIATLIRGEDASRPRTAEVDGPVRSGESAESSPPLPSSPAALRLESAKKTIGREVRNGRNQELARIKDLAIDPESGRVAFAILSTPGGFMGLGEGKTVAVQWAVLKKEEDGAYILSVEKEDLKEAPDFEKTGRVMRIAGRIQ